jgi:branched-subunit amino acid transport protein
MFLKKYIILVVLAGASLVLYLVDYFVLGNSRDIASSFLGNLAFLPIYVIFITLIVEQIVQEQERQAVIRKLNMVIGVFFSEVGNRLLKELSAYIVACAELKHHLLVNGTWNDNEFAKALDYLRGTDIKVSCDGCDKNLLKAFLIERRSFLVGLLENQNLMEHDQFTDLLWAVFHLVEELEARPVFDDLLQSDIEHINGDIKRVFGHLSREWLLYMQHLKVDYPYLFSLAVRLNPMIDNPDPLVH